MVFERIPWYYHHGMTIVIPWYFLIRGKKKNLCLYIISLSNDCSFSTLRVTALTFPTYCFPVPVHSSKRKKLFHIHPRLVRCRVRPSRSNVLIPGTGRISALLQPSKQDNRRKVSWLIIIVSDHSWRVLDKESIKKQSSVLKILLNSGTDEMGHLILNSLQFCLLGACDGEKKRSLRKHFIC